MNIFSSIYNWDEYEFYKINNFLKVQYKIDVLNSLKTKEMNYKFMDNNSVIDSIWSECYQLCHNYKITANSIGLKEFSYINKSQMHYDIDLMMNTLKRHIITSTYFTLNYISNKSTVNFERFVKIYYDSNSRINETKGKFINKIKKNTLDFFKVKNEFTTVIHEIFITSTDSQSINDILNFDININYSLLFLQLIINWRDCPFNPNRNTKFIYKFTKFRDYIILLYNQSKLNDDTYYYLAKNGICIENNSVISMHIIDRLFNYSFTYSLLFLMYIPSITEIFTKDIILITLYRFFYLPEPLNTSIMALFLNNFPSYYPNFNQLNIGDKYKSIISWQNNIQEFIDSIINYTLPAFENCFLLLLYKYYDKYFKNINIKNTILTDLDVYIKTFYFSEEKNSIDLKFKSPMLGNHDFYSYNTFEKITSTKHFNQAFNLLLENYKSDTDNIIYNNSFKTFQEN